jgi:succinoglycan biosynthesis transport protein ExoP
MAPNDELIRGKRLEVRRAEVLPAWSSLANAAPGSSLSWEQVIRVLRKHRWLLIAIAGGLTLATLIVALALRNVYQPVARLQIDPVGAGIKTLQEIENPRSQEDVDYLDTQVQVLQSDGLAMRVIRILRLDENPEFVSKAEVAEARKSSELESHHGPQAENELAFLREQLELADPTPTEAVALRKFHIRLTVNPIRGSRLIEIAFASNDPKIAQSVTNTLVSQFIDQDYRNRYITTMGASAWLSTQISDLGQKVTQSNRAVADFQKKYGLVDANEENVPIGQLMSAVSHQLGDAQADRIQLEAYMRMIEQGQQDSIPIVRDDVVYQTLLTRYGEVRAQVAQAQTVYGDENANVKKLQNQADELAAQVEAERTRLINRVRTGFAAAKTREQMVKDWRDKLRVEMGDLGSRMVEYQTLKNEAGANAQLYNTLQTRLREAGIYAGLKSGSIRVVDMAPYLHEATSPHRKLIIALGATLSVFLAFAVVFVRESMDNTVRIPDDIRDWLRLPSLAVLPRITANTPELGLPRDHGSLSLDIESPGTGLYPKLFWYRAQSAEAEAIRGLRASLLDSRSSTQPKVILVTSATAGEGKSTVAINLASVLAQHGNTCLVEGDLRRPMIELAMGLRATAGIVEVLSGRATLKEAIITETGVPGLSVLPVKSLPNNPADLLSSEQMEQVLTTLRKSFDYVVIDSPPIIPFSDPRSLALLADGVILVSRYGSTTRRAITRGAEILNQMQAPLLGVVLNDMDLTSADYHYFNYGYSWRRAKDESAYAERAVPPTGPDDSGPEKSTGAHA